MELSFWKHKADTSIQYKYEFLRESILEYSENIFIKDSVLVSSESYRINVDFLKGFKIEKFSEIKRTGEGTNISSYSEKNFIDGKLVSSVFSTDTLNTFSKIKSSFYKSYYKNSKDYADYTRYFYDDFGRLVKIRKYDVNNGIYEDYSYEDPDLSLILESDFNEPASLYNYHTIQLFYEDDK